METQLSGGENGECWDDFFIAVEGGSRAVRRGWSTAMMRIKCFSFSSRGRRRDEALLEDETEVASSCWLHRKEAWHGMVTWRHQPEAKWHPRGEREETMLVGLMWILLGQKMKKISVVNSTTTNGRWRFKAMMG
jgi:hypothetical protein